MTTRAVPATFVPGTITGNSFCIWVGQALPGDQIQYHAGFLGIDTSPESSPLSETDRRRLAAVAAAARRAFESDLVHLFQKRLGHNRFAYIAVARQKPRANPVPLSSLLPTAEAGALTPTLI